MSSEEMIREGVRDSYKEHELHVEIPDPECSECFKELHDHNCTAVDSEVCEVCERFASIIT